MTVLEKLAGGLIVSCQAPPGSPLDNPHIIAALAAAAERAGAAGVRINRPENIRAVRGTVRIPIVGIFKQVREGHEVYITPSFEAAASVVYAGADVVALDATARRPNGYKATAELIANVQQKLGRAVMADIASIEDGLTAAQARAALIATTLFGYTAATRGAPLPNLDLVRELVGKVSTPIVCEGGVQSPEQTAAAFEAGAFAVVVGTALTGIETRVRQFAASTPGKKASQRV